MTSLMKRASVALLAIVVAFSLCLPALSFADSSGQSAAADSSSAAAASSGSAASGSSAAATDGNGDGSDAAATTPADDCIVTLEYYENVISEEPGIPPDENGRYLLGTRQLTGLQEGTQLDTWDYVLDLTGYFFFDAWPAKLTVSTDPADNVIQLFYFRYSNYSYTVNYYLMTGADLAADSWSEALAPDKVEFHKLGSEVVENQPYGELVEGDAYEYKLDGAYVVDTYPPDIRVGVTPDNNTLNVLYVPQTTTLPDDIEIPDEVIDPGTVDTPNAKPPAMPNDETFDKDGITAVLPNKKPVSNEVGTDSGSSAAKPAGTATPSGSDTSDQGDATVEVPGVGAMTEEQIDELFRDFVGAESDEGVMEITDEMLANPVDPAVAKRIADAYITGYDNGTAAAEARCAPSITDHIICIIIMIILALLALIGFILYGREHGKLKRLQEAQDQAAAGAGATAAAARAEAPSEQPAPPIDPLE